MRTVKVKIETLVTVEIDDSNEIVQEYQNDEALIADCQGYKWSNILPVIKDNGVVLKDSDIVYIKIV